MEASFITPSAITAFLEILFIDVVLAGDNAIVVGALAAGLPAAQRKKVILVGVLAALVLRIAFALLVTQLLKIVGLILAGGILLLWVAWKMYREIRHKDESAGSEEIIGDEHSGLRPAKSFASAAWGVALADVGMSTLTCSSSACSFPSSSWEPPQTSSRATLTATDGLRGGD
jgi:predicted tellurium resistance membrane protein TerC